MATGLENEHGKFTLGGLLVGGHATLLGYHEGV